MSNYTDIILEDINHKFDAIMEGQAAMAHIPGAVSKLQEDMTEVKTDVKAIKAAVTDHSAQLQDHEGRISTLRRAA